jgi:hypothetical protein
LIILKLVECECEYAVVADVPVKNTIFWFVALFSPAELQQRFQSENPDCYFDFELLNRQIAKEIHAIALAYTPECTTVVPKVPRLGL